jgi:hypothetical protein
MLTDKLNLQGYGLKLLGFKEINKGNILYQFDLESDLTGLTIKECRLINWNGTTFVSFPGRQYEVDGKKKTMSYIYMPKEKKDKLDELVKKLIDEQFKSVPRS